MSNEISTHKFGGWLEAPARRWRNPDGSVGGIVANTAWVHGGATIPYSAEVLPYAKIMEGASIGDRATIGPGASIGYRASIGAHASIGDGASIGAHASIGDRATIGRGASIDALASIGARASIGACASIGVDAAIGAGAAIGYRTAIGDGVQYEKDDWLFVLGPQGSRGALAAAVYSHIHGLRWWVGCNHGITTDKLRALILETHGDTEHAADYLHAVQCVETHPGLKRAMSKAGEQ